MRAVAPAGATALFGSAAKPLLRKASVLDDMDEGLIALEAADDAAPVVQRCRKLHYWAREARVKQV